MGEQDRAERGLQRERTSLAWDRTGVSFLIASALLVRVVGPPYASLRHVPAAAGLALGGVLVAGLLGRREGPTTPPRVRPWGVRLTAGAAIGLSLACLIAVAV